MDDARPIPDEGDGGEGVAGYVGVYRLRRRLGRGGMGEVFLAHDDRLGRPVAIKRIRRDAESSEADRQRLRREARAVARLNHPAITQIYDVVEGEDGDSIVMEYVRGHTLAELLAAGELDGERASSVAAQVAEGLAEAHAQGIVHRDLKAENVMVTPEGKAKILDFGLAKALAPDDGLPTLTASGAVVGTFSTLSPEQAAGEPVDARSDLFSFGVLLYEMFTGRSPFRRHHRLLSLQSVLADHPPPPRALRPELPAALSDLIEELLAKEPERRPASAIEVGSRLRESSDAVAGLGAPATAPGTEQAIVLSDAATRSQVTPRPSRPSSLPAAAGRRASRWLWAVPALILLAAGVVLLGPTLGPGQTQPLRVLVLEPRISSTDGSEPSELVAFGVLQATLSALASLRGVDPIDPRSSDAPLQATWEGAREVAADEVLKTDMLCGRDSCVASFRRLDGENGKIGKTIDERYLPYRQEDALTRAQVVRAALLSVYSERRPRWPSLRQPTPEDYQKYLEIKLRNDSGKAGWAEVDQLEALVERSPDLIEAYLLAAEVARSLNGFERARGLVSEATRVDPEDPRLLFVRARIEIQSERLQEAGETVRELERVAPDDLRTLKAGAELHAARDERQQAIDVYYKIDKRWPSWRNDLRLADYEMSDRRTSDVARRRLEKLLAEFPDNDLVAVRLAQLDAWRGDLEEAEELFAKLRGGPLESFAIPNLGWIRFLAGAYGDAEATYREAIGLDPGDLVTRFNLALVWAAQGRRAEARSQLEELLTALEARSGPEAGCPEGGQCQMMEAQCLVRLGRPEEALVLTEQTLKQYPEDPQVIYQAAQVYALAGKRSSARHHTEQALKKILHPVWFEIPSFETLRSDREFQQILALYR